VNAQRHTVNAIELTSQVAFGSFNQEALPRVYRYFYSRLGGDTFAAEDLTQETFLSATREIKAGTMIEQPLPWVIGIARHKLLDHFRRQRPSNLAVQLAGQPDETLPELPYMPIEVGNEEGILEALRAVPAAQRDALILHFMDDVPVTEVAKLLGRTRSSAESLIWQGRVAFRKHYLESDDEH
jgi:RNA polymerase sigma-70 factor, ECF subfamily